MVDVPTVRGALATDALGTVLIHEHVFVRSPDVLTNYPSPWNEEERVADAVVRLRALKDRGVAFKPRTDDIRESADTGMRVTALGSTMNQILAS